MYVRRRIAVGAVALAVVALGYHVIAGGHGKSEPDPVSTTSGVTPCEDEVATWVDSLADGSAELQNAMYEFGLSSPKYALIQQTYLNLRSRSLEVGRQQAEADAVAGIRSGCAAIDANPQAQP